MKTLISTHCNHLMKIIFRIVLAALTLLFLPPAFAQNVMLLKNEMPEGVSLYAIDQKKVIANYSKSAFYADYNETAQVLCVADLFGRQVWMAKVPQKNWQTVYTVSEEDYVAGNLIPGSRGVSVDDQGRCLFSGDQNGRHLILATLDEPVQHLSLSAAPQEKRSANSQVNRAFSAIQNIIYHAQVGFLVATEDDYAIFPATKNAVPETLLPITPSGQIWGVEFYSLKGKGTFSPDGQTLYTYAEVADEGRSVFDALISIDVQSGRLKQIFLPNTGEGFSEDEAYFSHIYGSFSEEAIGISADAKTLYVRLFQRASFEKDSEILFAAIDIETSKVTPLTLPPELLEGKFLGVYQPNNHLIFETSDDNSRAIIFFDPQAQKIVQTISDKNLRSIQAN